MKKNILISSLIAIMALFLNAAFANAQSSTSFATINIEKISKEARVVKNIATQISKKRDSFQKQISAQEKKLEKEQKKLEAKKDILSSSALQEEQKKFFKKVEKLKNDATKKDKILKKAYGDSIKKVNDIVGEIVNEIAKDKGLSLVLPSSQVVYSIEAIDITSQVVAKLDKRVSKIKVKF